MKIVKKLDEITLERKLTQETYRLSGPLEIP